jgi:thioesterase domain-containing protein
VGRFRLERYDVSATLLKADKEWPVRPLDYGWTDHINGTLDIRIVAGDHWNMFSPEIGERLGQAVREALQGY